MTLKSRVVGVVVAFLLLTSIGVNAKQVLVFNPNQEDITSAVRSAIEKNSDPDLELIFEKGIYRFLPDLAEEKYCVITNHGNGLKKIIFDFKGRHSVEVEGNGSEFIFHGQVMPFLFEQCNNVRVNNVTIDWDIPFTFLGKVVAVNPKEGWREIKPFTDGFSWNLVNGQIEFPNIDGFNYSELGSTLAFDPLKKRVVHGGWDFSSHPRWVEKRKDGVLRIYEPMKNYPPVGSLLSSKGDRDQDRYAPAFEFKSSRDINLDHVVVHHALGMGYLFERSENITIQNSGVYLRKGTPRVISSTADATHFANCKGDILIENCRFENMLDDGTNVHGTYGEVNQILNTHTLRMQLKHFEQLGFEFAAPGDEIWFIQSPNPSRATVNKVVAAKAVNERFIELQFENELPVSLKKGDLLENKTWNPTFTMRGCTLQNNRARNVVLKTPLKTVIENNFFSSMMSSILFRGESYYWFESGAVNDVLIRNNVFEYCAYSGSEHSILNITPRLGDDFDQTAQYDRNIRFEDNTIRTFDNRIVWADRVDGLIIKGNKITQTFDAAPLYPDAPLFELNNSLNVQILGNTYNGKCTNGVVADPATLPTLKIKGNKGFDKK